MSPHVWFMIKIDGLFKWEFSMTSVTSEHVRETVETIDRQQFANVDVFRISENSKKYQITFI
jgi:hypothetical protein